LFLILVMGGYFYSRFVVYINFVKVWGIIIDKLFGRLYNRSATEGYYPQFQFSYHDRAYISADRGRMARLKKKDDKVVVIFPEGRPEQAVIYSFLSYWIGFGFLFVILLTSFLFLLIKNQYALFKKNFRRRK